jgi:tRNA (cmo5U34)-methyltransferase
MSTEASSLGHWPAGRWAFDEAVTSVFSDMLVRSIPQYDVMRKSVTDVGSRFAQPDTAIVDLGCSRGDALAPFVSMFGRRNTYLGVEVSQPMLTVARCRFEQEIDDGLVQIVDLDLRSEYPHAAASLTLCVLSLQFVPIEHRQRILRDAFANTVAGGAIILVEKILGAGSGLNSLMIDLYHVLKKEAGYTHEEVERKKLSLEGVLVPVTAQWNEDLLRSAGFREIDCFWRWMNFAGWVAVK